MKKSLVNLNDFNCKNSKESHLSRTFIFVECGLSFETESDVRSKVKKILKTAMCRCNYKYLTKGHIKAGLKWNFNAL